jgi:pectate lyase C
MSEAIARTDSPSTTVRMTNTRYSRIGRQLFIGFASGNVSQSGNVQY